MIIVKKYFSQYSVFLVFVSFQQLYIYWWLHCSFLSCSSFPSFYFLSELMIKLCCVSKFWLQFLSAFLGSCLYACWVIISLWYCSMIKAFPNRASAISLIVNLFVFVLAYWDSARYPIICHFHWIILHEALRFSLTC